MNGPIETTCGHTLRYDEGAAYVLRNASIWSVRHLCAICTADPSAIRSLRLIGYRPVNAAIDRTEASS